MKSDHGPQFINNIFLLKYSLYTRRDARERKRESMRMRVREGNVKRMRRKGRKQDKKQVTE